MKRKTTKTIAWVLLAVCIFMAGKTMVSTIVTIDKEEINPECLVVAEYAKSYDAQSRIYTILGTLNAWQNNTQQIPEFTMNEEEFLYYASVGEKSITNQPGMGLKDFQEQKYVYAVDYLASGLEVEEFSTFREISSEFIPGSSLYVAITEKAMATYQKEWNQDRDSLMKEIMILAVWVLLGLGIVVYSYAVAGRTSSDQELHLMKVDRLYTEIFIGLLVGTWGIVGLLTFGIFELVYADFWLSLSQEATAIIIAGFSGLLLLSIMFTMPLIRKIKAKRLLKDCLCVRAIKWCWQIIKNTGQGIKGFFDGSAYKEHLLTNRLFRSQLAYICGSAGLLLFMGLMSAFSGSFAPMLLFAVVELIITGWYVMGNKKAYSDINAGYVESIKSQMKSENTKTALITNVSHDLKTPLTSIITYVDLLGKEEGLSDTSKDYIKIIAGKAERLNHIVSDLFDLSKSVSGNIPLDMDILDLKTLMEQTLADMTEPIEGSGHGIKVNLGQEPVNIFSDGKKLYRVFQNIIDNALKYSLAGSRIFIDLITSGDKVVVTVKNTAGYEMNFTEEEIMQRFTRGDEARTGEGSGLGLSIAESFTQSCGGIFKLHIDGDQFKVEVVFPTVEISRRVE